MKKSSVPINLPMKRIQPPPQNKDPPEQEEKDEFSEMKISRITEFKKQELLGRGTYGKVFKAHDKRHGRLVAVKQLKMEKEREGFPLPAIREVKILKMVDHKNIVKLFDIIASIRKPKFWMIFEYVDHDLMGLLNGNIKFNESTIRHFVRQILDGVNYMHKLKIVHRDLKTSNLLITIEGVVKIADFGLARLLQDGRKHYTNKIVTRWYRSPELLLGETEYDYSIDMWSVGCIFAEIMNEGKAIFRGKNELDQLHKIFDICGTPSKVTWPGASKLRHWSEMKPKESKMNRLRKFFTDRGFRWSNHSLDLMEKMLKIDPKQRITASEALKHPWFRDRSLDDRNGRGMNIPREGNYNELRAQTGGGEDRGAIVGKKRYRSKSGGSGNSGRFNVDDGRYRGRNKRRKFEHSRQPQPPRGKNYPPRGVSSYQAPDYKRVVQTKKKSGIQQQQQQQSVPPPPPSSSSTSSHRPYVRNSGGGGGGYRSHPHHSQQPYYQNNYTNRRGGYSNNGGGGGRYPHHSNSRHHHRGGYGGGGRGYYDNNNRYSTGSNNPSSNNSSSSGPTNITSVPRRK